MPWVLLFSVRAHEKRSREVGWGGGGGVEPERTDPTEFGGGARKKFSEPRCDLKGSGGGWDPPANIGAAKWIPRTGPNPSRCLSHGHPALFLSVPRGEWRRCSLRHRTPEPPPQPHSFLPE